jgi:hypothetical protein
MRYALLKDLRLKIVLMLGGIVFAGMIVEFYFRMFDPQPPRLSEHEALFEYHSTLGWQFLPGKAGRVVLPYEHETVVQINSAGMRDREHHKNKPGGTKRILVLGDSFTSGLEVNADEVFTRVIQNLVPHEWEILNFGINGFGPTQYLLLLKQRAIHYQPDVVIVVVYVGNDFDDVGGALDWIRGYHRPRARLDNDEQLMIENIPVPESAQHARTAMKSSSRVSFKSHLVNFVRKQLKNKRELENMPEEVRLFRKNPSVQMSQAFTLMREVVNETARFSQSHGAEFVVVIAPTIVQVYDTKYWSMIKEGYALREEDYDLQLPNKFIQQVASDLDIRVLDLTPLLRSVASKGKLLYYPKNRHWNRAGHSVVGHAIHGWLTDSGIVK